MEKTKTPKYLAALFREWQELRIKVSEAEMAAVQEVTATEKRERNRRKPRKSAGRGRTH